MALTTLSDQELGLAELSVAARISELQETDSIFDYDGEIFPESQALFDELAAIRHEQEERARLGIVIQHEHERFEVRYAPFGPAWEEEQAERFEETGSFYS